MEVITNTTVDRFINELGPDEYAKTIHTIKLLGDFGRQLSPPHSKKLEGNLYELRVRADIQVRLLYGFWRDKAVVVHGFIKKTYKIPLRDIRLAKKRLKSLA